MQGVRVELCTDNRVGFLSDRTQLLRENSLVIVRSPFVWITIGDALITHLYEDALLCFYHWISNTMVLFHTCFHRIISKWQSEFYKKVKIVIFNLLFHTNITLIMLVINQQEN